MLLSFRKKVVEIRLLGMPSGQDFLEFVDHCGYKISAEHGKTKYVFWYSLFTN